MRNTEMKKLEKDISPLQQFAKEVQQQSKRYKNWESAYRRIMEARRLREEYRKKCDKNGKTKAL